MADKRTGAARVLVRHQGIPHQALRVGLDAHQRKVAQLTDLARHRVGRHHAMGEHPRPASPGAAPSGCGQRDVALSLERVQRFAAARALAPATGVVQMEPITDAVGDPCEAVDALRSGTVQHVMQSGKICAQATPDLILNLHGAHGSAGAR